MEKTKLANKTRPENGRKGLYNLLAKRLLELEWKYKEETKTAEVHPVIPFPKIWQKLCTNFSCHKETAWDFLFILRDFKFIEILPGHGVRLKDQIGDLNGR